LAISADGSAASANIAVAFHELAEQVLSVTYHYTDITMVEVQLHDSQRLLVFNDLFIGRTNHADHGRE
jgi:hypothetical protein